MNARISREFVFQSAIHYDNNFLLNSYLIELSFNVITENFREQNIALDRIKYLIDECFDSCVFIEQNETKAIELYSKAGIRVCSLPDEPYDQVVAGVLLSKFNVVTENKLFATEIRIKSNICDNVEFYISHEEDLEFMNQTNCWYTENNASIHTNKKSKKDKIVELKKEPMDWSVLNLSWNEKTPIKDNKEIVFVQIDK